MRVRIIVKQGFTTLADSEIAWQGTTEQPLSFERSCNHTGEFRTWCSVPEEENAGESDKGAYDSAFQAEGEEPAAEEKIADPEGRYYRYVGKALEKINYIPTSVVINSDAIWDTYERRWVKIRDENAGPPLEDIRFRGSAAFLKAVAESNPDTEERYPKFEGITQKGGLTRAARITFRCDKGHLTVYENAPLPLVGGTCRTCNEWVQFPAEDQPNIVRTRKPEDARGDEFEQQ